MNEKIKLNKDPEKVKEGEFSSINTEAVLYGAAAEAAKKKQTRGVDLDKFRKKEVIKELDKKSVKDLEDQFYEKEWNKKVQTGENKKEEVALSKTEEKEVEILEKVALFEKEIQETKTWSDFGDQFERKQVLIEEKENLLLLVKKNRERQKRINALSEEISGIKTWSDFGDQFEKKKKLEDQKADLEQRINQGVLVDSEDEPEGSPMDSHIHAGATIEEPTTSSSSDVTVHTDFDSENDNEVKKGPTFTTNYGNVTTEWNNDLDVKKNIKEKRENKIIEGGDSDNSIHWPITTESSSAVVDTEPHPEGDWEDDWKYQEAQEYRTNNIEFDPESEDSFNNASLTHHADSSMGSRNVSDWGEAASTTSLWTDLLAENLQIKENGEETSDFSEWIRGIDQKHEDMINNELYEDMIGNLNPEEKIDSSMFLDALSEEDKKKIGWNMQDAIKIFENSDLENWEVLDASRTLIDQAKNILFPTDKEKLEKVVLGIRQMHLERFGRDEEKQEKTLNRIISKLEKVNTMEELKEYAKFVDEKWKEQKMSALAKDKGAGERYRDRVTEEYDSLKEDIKYHMQEKRNKLQVKRPGFFSKLFGNKS